MRSFSDDIHTLSYQLPPGIDADDTLKIGTKQTLTLLAGLSYHGLLYAVKHSPAALAEDDGYWPDAAKGRG